MQTRRNRAIEFYRFLFCCIIYIQHTREAGGFGAFKGGYLGVEFFFIVSGFLMMRSLRKTPCPAGGEARDALRFLLGRYRRLYPPYLLSLLLLIAGYRLFDQGYGWKTVFLGGFPDFLAIQIFWKTASVGLHLWFVSALIWASFLVYYLVRRNRELFLCVIEPLALLLFIGFVSRRVGHLNLTERDTLWMSGLRAFAEVGLGCCLAGLYERLERAELRLRSWVCTALELVLLGAILLIMFVGGNNYADFIFIFLAGAFVLVSFVGRGLLSRALDNPVSGFLGSLSYLMYLNQSFVILAVMGPFQRFGFWTRTALSLLLLGVLSWLETQALRLLLPPVRAALRRFLLEKNAS